MIAQAWRDKTLPGASRPFVDAIEFQAPYLREKLLNDQIVETAREADDLFSEVKRYLILVETDRDRIIEMYSLRVDEVWHQFVLFTDEYRKFCRCYFGRYLSHAPSNAPRAKPPNAEAVLSLEEFTKEYERFFERRLPNVWHDHLCVTTRRRIINSKVGQWKTRSVDDMIALVDEDGTPYLWVSNFAEESLRFIARTGAFYVRELPGAISDEERIDLVAMLVELRFLRVAS